jgi:hypothetical protein
LIEVSIKEAFAEYARSQQTEGRVEAYVVTQLDGFQNPKMAKIVSLAGSFDSVWATELDAATIGELKAAIDSIVNNRNQIAHGENVTISLSQLREYYRDACKVLDLVDARCGL